MTFLYVLCWRSQLPDAFAQSKVVNLYGAWVQVLSPVGDLGILQPCRASVPPLSHGVVSMTWARALGGLAQPVLCWKDQEFAVYLEPRTSEPLPGINPAWKLLL